MNQQALTAKKAAVSEIVEGLKNSQSLTVVSKVLRTASRSPSFPIRVSRLLSFKNSVAPSKKRTRA